MRGALDKGGNPRVPPCSRGGWRVTAAQHYAPSPPTAVQLRGGGVPLEVSGGAGLLRWHTHTHTSTHTYAHNTHRWWSWWVSQVDQLLRDPQGVDTVEASAVRLP